MRGMNRGRMGAACAERGGDGFVPVAEVLDGYLDVSGLGVALARLRAMDDWGDAVGPRISRVTRPVEIRGETLVVEVLSSAWITELTMMGGIILKRVNARGTGPPIGRVRFRLAETAETITRSAGRADGHG